MAIRIHHTQKTQAANIGATLSVKNGEVEAFWPERAAATTGKTASEALEKMKALQAQIREMDQQEFPPNLVQDTLQEMIGDEQPRNEDGTLMELQEPTMPPEEIERNDKGVPLDGGIAHAEGFTAADCPYSSEDEEEYEDFERWNAEFDTHADEAEEEKGGSVVKEEYRARYAEMGHPTHCGDDMAVILNNLCQTKSETDLARFEAICEANGVSLAKYNRTTNGWQGRLRMTGRNMLARRVFEAGGVLKTPVEGAEPQYQMSAEWMATRKYVKEAK